MFSHDSIRLMFSNDQLVRLRRFAHETFWLMTASIVMPALHWAETAMYKFRSRDRNLFIGFSVFSVLIAAYAAVVFFVRGGARSHYPLLVVFCLLLYPFCILALYTTGMAVYIAVTMRSASSVHTRPEPMWAFSVLAAVGAVCALVVIGVTLSYPSSKAFLCEFQKSAKSRGVFLPNFLFVKTRVVLEEAKPLMIEDEADEYTINRIT